LTKDIGPDYYIPRNLPYKDIQMICRLPKTYPIYAIRYAIEKDMWDHFCQSRPELRIHSLYQQKNSGVKHGICLERKLSAQ
jgi:hypothetical protein